MAPLVGTREIEGQDMTRQLILLRHGQSIWNLENLFTGWTDIDLTDRGCEEAREAGRLFKSQEIGFDIAYTSVLKRAIRTLWITLDELDLMWIPVIRSWRLNERHYGALQGLNKAETSERHGADQVHIWRRSYATPPPPLEENDPRHPRMDPQYAAIAANDLPATESLKTTLERVAPCWETEIKPQLEKGARVLIAAHGNSLRALVKMLDNVSDEEITGFNIPTGVPLAYELDDKLEPLKREFLGDPDAIAAAAKAVADQAKGGKS